LQEHTKAAAAAAALQKGANDSIAEAIDPIAEEIDSIADPIDSIAEAIDSVARSTSRSY
jgi:tetrahydromethanopterin S-methyltransferase subunit B